MLSVGTSGWVYPHWRGIFYPEDLPQSKWFDFYARHFDTVEINNSFYRLPSRETFKKWRDMAPGGFAFAVKANRYITHIKKLKDPRESVANFYRNLSGMGGSCAVVLYQLPPRWKLNLVRLKEFVETLPGRYRLVFEFRENSWLCEPVFELLRDRGAALCEADMPIHPLPRVVTADFVFYRMHGGHGPGAPDYSESELAELAVEIKEHLKEGRDAFAYFNNDYEGYALKNATRLKEILA